MTIIILKKKDVGEKHTSNKEAELLNTQNTCIHKLFLKYLKATFVTCVWRLYLLLALPENKYLNNNYF